METSFRPAFDYKVRLVKIPEGAEDIVGTPIMQLVLPIILARYEFDLLPFLNRVVDKLK